MYVGSYTPVLPPQRGLYHSGVKNQRWGVRRYQNEDGSLTPLGRIHYGVGAAREGAAKAGKGIATGVKNTASAISKAGSAVSKAMADRKEAKRKNAIMKNPSKNMNKMTTEELRDYVERMKLEKMYVNEAKTVEEFKKSQSRVKEFFKNALERSGNKLIDGIMDKVVSEIKKDRSNLEFDPQVRALMKAEKIAKLNDSIGDLTRDKSKKYDIKDMLEHPEKYSEEDFTNARTAIDAMNNINKLYNQDNGNGKGGKGGNNDPGATEANNRVYDYDDVINHPEKYTPNQIQAALNARDRVDRARGGNGNRDGNGNGGQGDRNGGTPPTPSGGNGDNPPSGGDNGGGRRGLRGLFNRRNRGGDNGSDGNGNGGQGDRNGGTPPTPSNNGGATGGTRNDDNPSAPSNPSGSGRQSRADDYLRNRDNLRSQNGGTNNPPSSNSQGDRSNPPTPSGGNDTNRDAAKDRAQSIINAGRQRSEERTRAAQAIREQAERNARTRASETGQDNPTSDAGQDAVNRIMNSGGRAADYLRNRDRYRNSDSDSSTPPSNERIQSNADELQRRAEEIARRAGLRHMHVPGFDYEYELIHYAMR